MSYDSVPLDALVTNCLPNCNSRVRWEYDEGERMTRDYPGYPESLIPYDGCCEDHLEQLTDSQVALSTAWDQVYRWWELEEQAASLKRESRKYLGLKPIPTTAERRTNRENRERAENHAQTGR